MKDNKLFFTVLASVWFPSNVNLNNHRLFAYAHLHSASVPVMRQQYVKWIHHKYKAVHKRGVMKHWVFHITSKFFCSCVSDNIFPCAIYGSTDKYLKLPVTNHEGV